MKFHMIAAILAATFMVGCTKCSQQPTPETTPATEVAPPPTDTAPPTEGTTAESMPSPDQINEELPPESAPSGK